MSVVWKLEYEGEVRPLAQWGLENAKLDFGNQVLGTLTLTVASEDDSDPEFEFEKKVILWRDNVRWFHGWITQLPYAERAAGIRQEYVASDPWYWLDKTIYEQPRWVLVDPDQPNLGYAQVLSSRLNIFQSASGASSTAGQQAAEAVDYAIFYANLYNGGVPLFSRGDFSTVAAQAPWETGRDLSCAEVLRRCLRWTRDAVTWWDHSGEIPVLQVQRRASLTAAELAIDDADRIAEYSLTPRPDLVPVGVVITYERTRMEVDGSGAQTGSQWTQLVTQKYPLTTGKGPRVVTATLTLSGAGDGAEPVPSGLAQNYYESLATMPWEGSLRLLEADPTGVAMVGNRLNFTGGRTAWETMDAVIQRVSIDIAARETVVEYGPAEQLGPQEFLDQVRFQRGSSVGNSGGGRFDGVPDGPSQPPRDNPPSPPSGPPGTPGGPQPGGHFIEVCQGGETKTIFVGG
jgi:hypothetical protein